MNKLDYDLRDKEYWQKLRDIFDRSRFSDSDVLQHFAAYVRRRDLVRFLAHYELFKHVVDLPGHILEGGVFRGDSFFTWVKLMETFCPGDRSRKVFGFDHFRGLGEFTESDGQLDVRSGKLEGGYASSLENIIDLVQLHNNDNLIAGIERCRVINGDIRTTLPAFLKEHPGIKIALLHLDMDLYTPTRFMLDQLYDRVLTGGVVVLDEYGLVPWEGETKALDEFCSERKITPIVRKFPFSQTPHGYFLKE